MLKCEKCGKLYLKKDHSPGSGDKKQDLCDCGGNLIYFQGLMDHVLDEMDPFNELIISPDYTILTENKEYRTVSGKKKLSVAHKKKKIN